MGFVMTLLSALGCGGSRSGSTMPAVSDYDVTLHRGKALSIDPVPASGRFQIVPDGKLVLEFRATLGKSAIAYDTESTWTVVVELPAAATGTAGTAGGTADPTQPLTIALDGIPAVARVAGEDVLYLAHKAKGRLTLRTAEPASGDIELTFDAADRDLIKLGTLALRGSFKAKIR